MQKSKSRREVDGNEKQVSIKGMIHTERKEKKNKTDDLGVVDKKNEGQEGMKKGNLKR